MLLDKKLKKKLFATLIIAMILEIIVSMPLFRSSVLNLQVWRSSVGSVAAILGTTLCYVITILPFSAENKRLKFAMIANPGVTGILAGLAVFFWDSPKFEWLFLMCSFGAVISFLISFILLTKHFVVTAKTKE